MSTKKLTKETFISKANTIHSYYYDYSKVDYTNNKVKVIIVCPVHGDFEQTPHNHLNGSKCPICSKNKRGFDKRKTHEKFLIEAKEVHENKYQYKSDYVDANTKIIINCPTHGDFEQTPKAHITLKQGCPICHYENVKNNAPSWKKENWVNHGNNSKLFDGFKLYVIKCYNDTESFYKIGRTYTKLYRRFSQIPYNVEVVKIINSTNGGYIFDLEKRLKNKYKQFKYIPSINFGGKHECFKPLD
jgi:hypothetical protein